MARRFQLLKWLNYLIAIGGVAFIVVFTQMRAPVMWNPRAAGS